MQSITLGDYDGSTPPTRSDGDIVVTTDEDQIWLNQINDDTDDDILVIKSRAACDALVELLLKLRDEVFFAE